MFAFYYAAIFMMLAKYTQFYFNKISCLAQSSKAENIEKIEEITK